MNLKQYTFLLYICWWSTYRTVNTKSYRIIYFCGYFMHLLDWLRFLKCIKVWIQYCLYFFLENVPLSKHRLFVLVCCSEDFQILSKLESSIPKFSWFSQCIQMFPLSLWIKYPERSIVSLVIPFSSTISCSSISTVSL